MFIYWREWVKPHMTKEEARNLADEFRRILSRIREERAEMEKIAKRVDKAAKVLG